MRRLLLPCILTQSSAPAADVCAGGAWLWPFWQRQRQGYSALLPAADLQAADIGSHPKRRLNNRASPDSPDSGKQEFSTLATPVATQPQLEHRRRGLDLQSIPTFQVWQQQRQQEQQASSHLDQQGKTDWRELLDKAKQSQMQQQAGPSMLTDTFRWVLTCRNPGSKMCI